jgi:CheY-like chemotaxis protein
MSATQEGSIVDLTGKRVFLVEDEALVSMMFEHFLEDLGCAIVGTAARLDDALDIGRTLAMDVAILDINLNRQLSYPVAEMLQARGIPFLFATGYGMAGVPAELRAVPVLSKPFRQQQLAEALIRVIGGS